MTAAPDYVNGEWPDLSPVVPPIEDLPEKPTPLELARCLGSTLFMFGQLWPKSVHAIIYLKAALERIERLPPMRGPLGSSADLVAAVGLEAAQRIEAEARNPQTPAPDVATMRQLIEDPVAVAITRLKAEQWDRLEAERKAAEEDRVASLATARHRELELELLNAKERIKFRWASRLAVLTAVLAAIGWALHLLGHAP